MGSSEVEEERPELTYYEDKYCESCQQLDKKVMKEEYDDKDYLYEDDDFRNNETLKLHVIHYRRSVRENGLFYFGCPPLYDNLHARPQYPRQHFIYEPDFDEIVEHCALFAVGTYNEKLDAEMELVEIENASFEGWGRRRFYMVIRCSDDGNHGHVVPLYRFIRRRSRVRYTHKAAATPFCPPPNCNIVVSNPYPYRLCGLYRAGRCHRPCNCR